MKKENLNNVKSKAYYQNLKVRYLNAARDASGDRVLREYNLQFAEHYSRLIEEKFPSPPSQQNEDVSEIQDGAQQSEEIIENKTKCIKAPRKILRKPRPKIQEPEIES